MKDENVDRPQAMKIRQDIQEAMTFSLPNKKFCEEEIELVEIDIGLDKLGWNFQNFRILNLTDIHLGQWINPEYLDELEAEVTSLYRLDQISTTHGKITLGALPTGSVALIIGVIICWIGIILYALREKIKSKVSK